MTGDERDDCVFCRILAGKEHGYIVDSNEHAAALLDTNPLAQGHSLVISRRHVEWWHDLSDGETDSLFRLARRTAERIMKAFDPEFVCMYARGRRIPHTHIFLVPTSKGDPLDRYFNALEGFQESAVSLTRLHDPGLMAETLDRLRRTS